MSTIKIVRNEIGNCINFEGTTHPTYWNGCLTAETDGPQGDLINIINQPGSNGSTRYEFYNIPYTEFLDSSGDAFLSASACAAYITAEANVLGGGGPSGSTYLGVWNADTNTPTLAGGTHAGDNGDFYFIGTSGSTSIDGEDAWSKGDKIVWNGTVWQKINSVSVVDANSRQVLLNTQMHLFGDGEIATTDPDGDVGWHYTNTEQGRITWSMFGDTPSVNFTLDDFNGFYKVTNIKTTGSKPQIIIYTKPQGDGNDETATYRSRIDYIDDASVGSLAVGKYLIHSSTLDVTGIHPELTRTSITKAGSSVGLQAGSEEILSIIINTEAEAAGVNDFTIESIGIKLGDYILTSDLNAVTSNQEQTNASTFYRGVFAGSGNFPIVGHQGQWLIDSNDARHVSVWDQTNGAWVDNKVVSSGTITNTPIPYVYGSGSTPGGYGVDNAEGNWCVTINSALLPKDASATSDNRAMVGRLKDPGDTVVLDGISTFTSRGIEFSLVAWMPTEAPEWIDGINLEDALTTGWTNNAGGPSSNKQVFLTGGTANRWAFDGFGANWITFIHDKMYHKDYGINTEVKFRLCNTNKVQAFLDGDFIAESEQAIDPAVGAEIWLLAPEGRSFPQPDGGISNPPIGGGEITLPSPNHFMTSSDPIASGLSASSVLASGEGYWLYQTGEPTSSGDAYLSVTEAEAAKGCRVFHDFSGLSLYERKDITTPVIHQDLKALNHSREDAFGYFHTLDLTVSEIASKMVLYKPTTDAIEAGSVEIALLTLQALNITNPLQTAHNYVADMTQNTGSKYYAWEYFGAGDPFFDQYGITSLQFGHKYVEFIFATIQDYTDWRASQTDMVLNAPNSVEAWEDTYLLTLGNEHQTSTSSLYIRYKFSNMSSGERNDIAEHCYDGLDLTVTINGTGNSTSTDLNEQDVVDHLIEELEHHLKKFPR